MLKFLIADPWKEQHTKAGKPIRTEKPIPYQYFNRVSKDSDVRDQYYQFGIQWKVVGERDGCELEMLIDDYQLQRLTKKEWKKLMWYGEKGESDDQDNTVQKS
jgi:hypothetical protein